MALEKERPLSQDSHAGLVHQARSLCDSMHGGGLNNKAALEVDDGGCCLLESLVMSYHHMSHLRLPTTLYDPSIINYSSTSTDFTLGTVNSHPLVLPKESQSTLNFNAGGSSSDYSAFLNSSVLNFEQGEPQNNHLQLYNGEDYLIGADALEESMNHQLNFKYGDDDSRRLPRDVNCFITASGREPINANTVKDDGRNEEEGFGWLYSESVVSDSLQRERRGLEGGSHKRPLTGGDLPTTKKHCAGISRKSKSKAVPPKDPQSIAAKNRRERISERLKILQDLLPNGTKVDLVTMLEKAISYVKFLQLQVKVLATDELWPAQGGKAPEVAQVKEAIDAILSSHRDRNSSSN